METLDEFADLLIDQEAKKAQEQDILKHKNELISTIKHRVTHLSKSKKTYMEAQKELNKSLIAYRVYVWQENGDELSKMDELPEQSVKEVLADIYK